MRLDFFVPGVPATAGSKRAIPFRKDGGKLGVRVFDNDKNGKSWRTAVVAAAREAYRGPVLEGPLFLVVEFALLRPKGHTGKRGILPSAPAYPTTKPDATKLLRCLEDALTGILWRDDSQIVTQIVRKRYSDTAGALVQVGAEVAA